MAERRRERSAWPTRLTTLAESDDAGDLRATTTPQERWNMMWQLACNAYAFSGKPVAEPGPQNRQVERVIRPKS